MELSPPLQHSVLAPQEAEAAYQAAVRAFLPGLAGAADNVSNLSSSALFGLNTSAYVPHRFQINYLRAYSDMPWLRACLHVIATAVASTQWYLYQAKRAPSQRQYRGQYRVPAQMCWPQPQRKAYYQKAMSQALYARLDAHELLDVLAFGNAQMPGLSVMLLSQLYLDLVGECFWLLQPAQRESTIEAIWPIPPYWVKELPGDTDQNYLVQFETGRGNAGQQYRVPAELLIHMRDPDPYMPYRRGSGVARTLSDDLEVSEYAVRYVRAFFYNSARPDFLVTGKGLNEAAVKRIKEAWTSEGQGFMNAFRPFFLESDAVNVTPVQSSLTDIGLGPLRDQERDIIMQCCGVPPEILGVLSSSNRATIEAADLHMAKYVTTPRLEFLRVCLQRWIVTLYGDGLYLEFESPVPDDKEYKLKVFRTAPNAFTINEHRALAAMDPWADGDRPYEPVQKVPLQAATTETAAVEAAHVATVAVHDARRSGPVAHPCVRTKADDAAFMAIADALLPRYRATFLEACRIARAAIDTDGLIGALQSGDIPRVFSMLPWAQWESALDVFLTYYQAGVVRAAALASTSLATQGVVVDLQAEGGLIRQILHEHHATLLAQLNATTREGIRETLTAGQKNGVSLEILADQLQARFGVTAQHAESIARFEAKLRDEGASATEIARRVQRYTMAATEIRADMIAETESLTSVNHGPRLLWQQAMRDGALQADEWRQFWTVSIDDQLCPICEPVPYLPANSDVAIGATFLCGDGLRRSSPPAHQRCRCLIGLRRKDA